MGLDIPKTDRVVGGSSGGTRFYIFLLLGASLCQGPCGWGVEITRSCVIARLGTAFPDLLIIFALHGVHRLFDGQPSPPLELSEDTR